MNRIEQAFSTGTFQLDLEATDVDAVFRKTLDFLVDQQFIHGPARNDVESALRAREREVSTAIGHAVAVPHCYLDCLDEPLVVFVRLARPLNLGAPDGIPTRYFFMLLGPRDATAEHLDTLASIARLMSDDEFRYDLGRLRTGPDFLQAINDFIARTTAPVRMGRTVAAPLQFTGRWFGGLANDVARRLPFYVNDFTAGLNAKCASSIVFLFFACLAPAITFGGIMGQETNGQIGVVEMLIATAVCGTIYSFLAGQPLIILGGIGPLLIFTAILHRLCLDMQLPFLPTYAWVGFWTSLMLILLASIDASVLMRHFTRFTDEIFSTLMSLLFVYEALRATIGVFQHSFANDGPNHDTAFLALLLVLGTFYVATNLSRFRNSRYLLPWMREFLADFGPTIALGSMTVIALLLRDRVHLPSLQAPDAFGTTTGRPWLVDPFAGPTWSWFAAAGPAVLATLLIFLSHNITARLINSPDHRLQKGAGYHLDLAVVGGLVGVCSAFGWPWLVAATVRSLAHVRALATLEEVIDANGDRQERIIHLRENRLTGLVIHLLIGVSLTLLAVLKLIPMAVLYGVFLFMGVVSLAGNQFFQRLTMFFMDSSLYPRTHYIRQVPIRAIHYFTAIQAFCLFLLCAVSLAPIEWLRLLFPLLIALLVPVRLVMSRMFKAQHLDALDADETPREEESHWSG